MATNYVQPGDNLTVAAPAAVSSGDVVVIGALAGVALHDAASGADVALGTEGVYNLPADTGITMAVGDSVYWDSTNGWVDKTVTAQRYVGVAVEAKIAATATIAVKLGFAGPTTGN